MLSNKDYRILSLFAALVRQRFLNARVWAFGSRARGIATEESDLDVCVVVNRLDEKVDQAIMDIAWRVGFEHDLIISTVTYSQQEFEKGPCSESTLVQNILEEGVVA
ncbi:MAG: nucleotidyltransferase domain-containing protein [bacterium]|nr:nucleotidyltransferase domain-containing protein [bacterium]